MNWIRRAYWLGATLALLFAGAPGIEAATVLTSCGPITASGSYVVAQDITRSGDCFTIQANHVAIDLQGHTITGNGSGGRGITDGGTARAGIIITNGTITKFSDAINLYSSSFITVDRMGLSHNTGTGITTGGETTVIKSEASGNGNVGVLIYGSTNTMIDVTVENNSGGGISLYGSLNTMTRVKANQNGSSGIYIQGGSNTVSRTKANKNGYTGIFIGGGSNSVTDATANENYQGIYLGGGANVMVNVKVNKSLGHIGLYISGSANTLSRIAAQGNASSGIVLYGGVNSVTSVVAKKNAYSGIIILDSGNRLTDIKAQGNQSIGVDLDCPSVVSRLTALGNSAGNLSADTTDGNCTYLGVKAP